MGNLKSVLTDDTEHCFVCGSPYVEEHHCVHGVGRRKVADRLHLTVPLCRTHHEEVHHNRELDLYFIQMAQDWYEENIGTRDDWIEEIGKSWL